MLAQLLNHITEHDINEIIDRIQAQYRSYIRLTNTIEFSNLFAEEYAPHKRQHSISWAISSAFPSDSCLGDLMISRLEYGIGHTRPVLSNENIELHILSCSVDYNAKYLKERYLYNSENFSKEKLFCYIKFQADKRRLKMVELCLPDKDGIIIASEVLLSPEILKLVA